MRNLKRIILILLGLFAVSIPVAAQENSLATNGYLIKFKEPILFLAEETENSLIPVLAEEGLYKTDEKTAFALKNENQIEYIEKDCLVHLADDDTRSFSEPNDPLFPNQWNLFSIGYPLMRKSGLDGKEIRIGIIDTGISTTHEDLKGRVAGGFNFCDNNDNYNDLQGHGSFVAGIIGAVNDNHLGISGGSNARLYALKAFDGKTTYISTIVKAMDLAVNTYHCDILNLSFTTDKDSKTLRASIEEAVNKGVFLVAAVGNESSSLVNYPAAYDGVIGVASFDEHKKHSSFSNWNQTVDAAVPGKNITSIRITDQNAQNSYGKGSGTSYAAPHMTLLISYLLEIDPTLTTDELMQLIKNYAEDLGNPGYDVYYGWGFPSISYYYQQYGGLDILPVGKNQFETSFFNYTDTAMDAVHIWALYDTHTGLLVDVKTENYTLLPKEITKLSYCLPIVPVNEYQLKSIWVDTMENMLPLTNAKTFMITAE